MSLPFRVYLITDRRLAPGGDLPALLQGALRGLPGHEVAVQLREKDLGAAALLDLGRAVRAVTRAAGARLLVNDRIDVALALGADGVHLAGHSLPPAEARQILGPNRLLGASTHSLQEAEAARHGGCDFATFGPVYPTPSKARYGPPVGLQALETAARALQPFPLVALGGVTRARAPHCLAAGAAAISVIREVLAAPAPDQALAALLRAQPARSTARDASSRQS